MLKIAYFLLIIACATSNASYASDFHIESRPAQVSMTAAELTKILRGNDYESSIKALNNVKGMRYSGHLVPTIVKLWNRDAITGINKEFISSPRIRIELADILLQLYRNGAQGLDAKAYEEYARSLIKSPDHDVARQAILVLGIANNPKDKNIFIEMFADKKNSHWRAAGLSLIANCATSHPTIQQLSTKVSNERSKFIQNAWEAQKNLRDCQNIN